MAPTNEEAQQAANTLLTYIRSTHSTFDQNDYLCVMRLAKKLEDCWVRRQSI